MFGSFFRSYEPGVYDNLLNIVPCGQGTDKSVCIAFHYGEDICQIKSTKGNTGQQPHLKFDALELLGNCKQIGCRKGGPKSDSRYKEHDNKNKAEKEQAIHSVQTYLWNDLRKNKTGNACVQNKGSNHEIFEQCNRDGRYSQFVFAILFVTVALGYIIVAGLLFWHFLSTHNSWLFSKANFLSNPVKIAFFYSFGVIGAYSFALMLRTLTEFSFRIPALLRTVSEVGLLVSFFWPVPLYLVWGMWGYGALCLLSGLLLAFIWTRAS